MNNLSKAIQNLGFKRTLSIEGQRVNLACILREEDMRPLQAAWWKGKESSVIAVDDDGNFFLRHCGGYIVYWVHVEQSGKIVAKSIGGFLQMIGEDK